MPLKDIFDKARETAGRAVANAGKVVARVGEKAGELARDPEVREQVGNAGRKAVDHGVRLKDRAVEEGRRMQQTETYRAAADKVSEMAESETAQKAMAMAESLAGAGKEKFLKTTRIVLSELRAMNPILGECGIAITDFAVAMSVPPAILISIERVAPPKVPIEEILLREEPKLTRFQETLLVSVDRAFALEKIAADYQYSMGQIVVEMSIPPKVEVHFKPEW